MKNRDLLRSEAKRIYKEQAKSVPKNQRMSFSEFFKRFKKEKYSKSGSNTENEVVEDFDIEELENINSNIIEDK